MAQEPKGDVMWASPSTGNRMRVLEAGPPDRPALLLLHGMGTGADAWRPQLVALSGRWHVLAPDLPGFGGSAGPFSVGAAADLARELLDARATGQAAVCGLSLGALVALDLSLSRPGRVAGLVAVAGFAYLPERLRADQAAFAAMLRGLPDEAAAGVTEQLVGAVPPAHRQAARAALVGFVPRTLADVVEEASAFDVRDACPGFDRPALVAWGARDSANAPLGDDLAARLPGAARHVVPDAGHVANLDAAEAFTAMLDRFMGEAASRPDR